MNNVSDTPNGLRWRDVYSEHADGLFGYLARRVGPELAEDLLADTFVEAMASVSSFDPERGSVRTWLFGIASNLVRRHWRTEERRLRALARDAASPVTGIDPLLTVTSVVDRVDAATEVDALIDELGRARSVD